MLGGAPGSRLPEVQVLDAEELQEVPGASATTRSASALPLLTPFGAASVQPF
eukprot:gene18762-2339_t